MPLLAPSTPFPMITCSLQLTLHLAHTLQCTRCTVPQSAYERENMFSQHMTVLCAVCKLQVVTYKLREVRSYVVTYNRAWSTHTLLYTLLLTLHFPVSTLVAQGCPFDDCQVHHDPLHVKEQFGARCNPDARACTWAPSQLGISRECRARGAGGQLRGSFPLCATRGGWGGIPAATALPRPPAKLPFNQA